MTHSRLIGSHGEIHSGAMDAVDSAPIKPAPREKRLCADDDTALHIRRRNFERCPVEDAARLRPQTVRIRHINAFVICVIQYGRRPWRNPGGFWRARFFRCLRCVRSGRICWPRARSGRRAGSDAERALRLGIQLAGNLQSVANLITADRGGRIRIFFPVDLAVVKSLVF